LRVRGAGALPPGHLIGARGIAERLALRLHHGRLRAAVAVDRLQKEPGAAGAEDRAVAGIVAVEHARAGGGLLELHRAELLVLAVEEGDALEELRQLGGVERLVDAADAELRGGGADEREDVRARRLVRLVNRAIELDERLELAPARRQRRARVAHGPRREADEHVVEALLAEGLDEGLLAGVAHYAFEPGCAGLRAAY